LNGPRGIGNVRIAWPLEEEILDESQIFVHNVKTLNESVIFNQMQIGENFVKPVPLIILSGTP
jgi:hypothetical protein